MAFLRYAALLGYASAVAAQPLDRHESVIVTGSWEPVPLEEADRTVRSLDVRALRLVSSTFADFLRLDSSLDLRQRSPNAIQGDLSIRGSTFGQTLVLLNGLRLNDVQSGHHNLDIPVPIEAVDRIEILRGSGSTLYGSDAVGGVVNVITRKPETSEMRLRTAAGSWGTNEQRGVLTIRANAFSQQLSFARDFSTGFVPNRDYRNLSAASVTGFASRLGQTELTLAHNDRPFGAERFYGNFSSWERTKGWFAALRQNLGARTQAALAFRRHTDLFVLHRYRPELYTNRHAVESWQITLRRLDALATNTRIYWGGEALRDAIDSNNLGGHDRARGAAYVALDARALRRFSFNAGVRDEVWGSANHVVSPSFSGGFWILPVFRVRASASRAFRLPTYTDLYYRDPANAGSPHLRPERAWNYEAGIDWSRGSYLRAGVTVFHRRERDGIDYVRRSPAEIWTARNFQRLEFTGVEASAAARLYGSQSLELQYTALHGAQNALAGYQSKYVFNYPVHAGLASWHTILPRDILVRVRAGALERVQRDPYGVVDAYAARARGNVRPFVHVTNLTGTAYEEIAGVAMPGRGIVAGIELLIFSSR
ncbi:MAG TPA: TonB-dependent receptor [Bryobacteraceae bacterium]|nr:TonB-dependent receptor [Bryobacteraceae bacterium]